MVMTARALHAAYEKLYAERVSPGMPAGTPTISANEIQFVPWRDGINISGSDQWGFTWFTYPVNFVGINDSGIYLIENFTDSYLILGNVPVSQELISTLYQATFIPPFTAGIYSVGQAAFICTCICAGYDFTTPRIDPGANSAFLSTRGSTAHVHIVSLSSGQSPAVLPQLRNGWVRRYDWYDLTPAPHSSISVTQNGHYNFPNCDFTGAKGITAGALITVPASGGAQININASSAVNNTYVNYNSATNSTTTPGNAYITASGTNLTGVGPYLQILNNLGSNAITILDAYVEVTF